jgi:hypothetical protein
MFGILVAFGGLSNCGNKKKTNKVKFDEYLLQTTFICGS